MAVNKLVTRQQRRELMRSWSGLAALLPKGGNAVWGDQPLIQFSNRSADISATDGVNREFGFVSHYEHGLDEHAQPRERRWTNPLLAPLPNSTLKMICLYGVGKLTENRYHYEHKDGQDLINTSVTESATNTEHGIVHGDGDGTVPLPSLGFMCVEGWRAGTRLNPSGPVVTREYQHTPDKNVRGGPKTADHVDILGNHEMTRDVLRLVAGHSLESRIESGVLEESRLVKARLEAERHRSNHD